jgi:hypothetical protein
VLEFFDMKLWAVMRSNYALRSKLDEANDCSILKTGASSATHVCGQRSGRPTAATIAKRFSAVAQIRHPKHAHQCLLIEEQRTRAVGQDRSIEASLK